MTSTTSSGLEKKMNDKTRLKFGMIAFFSMLATAIAKHWLSGISETLVISACVPVVMYIIGETWRSSKK